MVRLAITRLDDVPAMRAIRLEMLSLHPEAFSADLEAEEAMTLEDFAARATKAAWFGGYIDGALAGVVVFSKPERKKIAHTGDLGAMYVRKDRRGTGLADALVEAVIDHAIGLVEQLKLTVNAENPRAIALYERHGFRTVGRIPRSIRVGGRAYDELMMIRAVSATD
jgi:ribosomal protein S18 acetylase RimI-like enzyme